MAMMGVLIGALGLGIVLHAAGLFPQTEASRPSPAEWPIGILMIVAGIAIIIYADRRKA